MKKRNYVVAIGLIALFIQTDTCAMGRVGRWAGQAKAMTVDKLYDSARSFVKEVKALLRCRKAGNCTPEQNRKVRIAGAAIGTAAVAATAAALVGVGVLGYTYRRGRPPVDMPRVAVEAEGELTDEEREVFRIVAEAEASSRSQEAGVVEAEEPVAASQVGMVAAERREAAIPAMVRQLSTVQQVRALSQARRAEKEKKEREEAEERTARREARLRAMRERRASEAAGLMQ